MLPNFTGRAAERALLGAWLEEDWAHPLLVVRALGGFGKSALAWQWLMDDVAPGRWPRVVWWSFYDEREFEAFAREAVGYLAGAPRAAHLPTLRPRDGAGSAGRGAPHATPRQLLEALLRLMYRPGTLVVLDGFERALRAYDSMGAAYQGDDADGGERAARLECISPLAEVFLRGVACLPGVRGKVLMTTRLRPRAVEAQGGELVAGCREEELTQMAPADAVAFFRAQGIRGGRAEIEAACAPYGYHPLSLRLVAGLVARDLAQPGDIAAAGRLDVAGELVQRRHHVLERAYGSLAPAGRQLLSQIACFRGPVGYEALRAVGEQTFAGSPAAVVDEALRDLVGRGLLQRDVREGRYDLHPIVRRYAYDRLAGGARAEAHAHLRDYFAAVPAPERAGRVEELGAVIELYHHTVRAGQYDEACDLFRDRLHDPLYYQFGAYGLCIELLRALFPEGEGRPPRLKKEGDQGWTLAALANSYGQSGQPGRAVPLFERQIAIRERQGKKDSIATGLGNLATQQVAIGALRAGEAGLRQAIALCREIGDEFREAIGHRELGRLLAYRGAWEEAGEALAAALGIFEKQRNVQSQGIVWAYRALRALLLARRHGGAGDGAARGEAVGRAAEAAGRALALADETAHDARFVYPVRDYVDAHWLLGAARGAAAARGEGAAAVAAAAEADRHLTEALTRCRGINMVDHEADILLDLARLRAAQGEGEEAERLAGEALAITERSGYALQGADAHLFLAERARARGEGEEAVRLARRARDLARCDGPPDYTYKVAWEEAGALLERLGQGTL